MKTERNFFKRFRMFRVLILFCFIIFLGIALLLLFGEMENTVVARGQVEGIYDYRLRAIVDAQMVKICKREGHAVKKGDILIQLDDRLLRDRILQTSNLLKELQAEYAIKENTLKILRNDPLPKEYRNVRIELDECQKKFKKSKTRLETYTRLFKRKVISRKDYEDVELEHITNASELRQAEKDYERVAKGLGAEIISRAENELKLLKTRIDNCRASLKQQKTHLADYRITAPVSGIVTAIPDLPGGYVKAGDIVARVSAVNERKFVVYVDQEAIHKVESGQTARILSDSFNYFEYGYFGGRVIKVSELPISRKGKYLYPVEVLVTYEPYQLKLGSSAEIKIVTGKEKIIFCLLGQSH